MYKYLYVIPPGTLAVNCNSFTAQKIGEQALLKWQNVVPSNTLQYIIEYSSNGTNFTPLQTIMAGNNNSINTYQTSAQLLNPINYFRLQQISANGTKTQICNIQKINAGKADIALNIYPNPVKDICYIQLSETSSNPIAITITNNKGQVVKTTSQVANNNGLIKLDIQNLVTGTYYIKVYVNGISFVDKLIKE